MHRQAPPCRAAIGVALIAWAACAAAGCGGGAGAAGAPVASSPGASTSAAASTSRATPIQRARPSASPGQVGAGTPQQAVRGYLEGIHTANGKALCDLLDERLQRALIRKIASANPVEAGDSCAQAMTELAAEVTSPGEHRPQVPPMQVTIAGDHAVVTYIGLVSHEQRTYRLLRHGSGWLLDNINGTG